MTLVIMRLRILLLEIRSRFRMSNLTILRERTQSTWFRMRVMWTSVHENNNLKMRNQSVRTQRMRTRSRMLLTLSSIRDRVKDRKFRRINVQHHHFWLNMSEQEWLVLEHYKYLKTVQFMWIQVYEEIILLLEDTTDPISVA